ncbi:MAG: thioredoxin family protein [Aureliella sp.]
MVCWLLRRDFLCSILITLGIQLTVNGLLHAQQSNEDIGHKTKLKWYQSLNEAIGESQRTGKPILMEIHGRPWCPPCVVQGEKIMDRVEFESWVREKFVLLEIQVGEGYASDKGNPIWYEQFKKYQLPGIPATVLLDTDLKAMGTVFPKPDVSQWLGAASNILTTHSVREQSASRKPIAVIPFRTTPAGNISVPATLDGRIGLNLMFHTAVNEISLTKDTTTKYPELKFAGEVESTSWGGRSTTRFAKSRLAIGDLDAEEITFFEDVNSGAGTDGKFGPEQLRTRVFEVDFGERQIRLLRSVPADIASQQSGWRKHKLQIESGMMLVTAELSSEQHEATADFMLHSGYSGFGLVGDKFASQTPWLSTLAVESESSLKDSAGNQLITKLVHVPEFRLGDEIVESAPISFFDGALGKRQFNVLGCDFMSRFSWCFDTENGFVYCKGNSSGED